MKTTQITGVSPESAELTISDAYLRTANEAGPDKASQSLNNLEADAAANPNSLKKLGDVAKLHDNGYDAVAYQASDSIADKLSAGTNPRTALEDTYVPKAVSLKADEVVKSVDNSQLVAGDEQQSSLSGSSLAAKDPNLIENPKEDPNLFELSSPTEQEQAEQTNVDDGLSASSSSFAGGTTEGGGAPTTTDDGTTPPDTGDTASLKAGDEGTGGAPTSDTNTVDGALDKVRDTGDASSDGDISDSSGSDSEDSSDSSDSSDDSGDSDDGGDDDGGDGDGDGGDSG